MSKIVKKLKSFTACILTIIIVGVITQATSFAAADSAVAKDMVIDLQAVDDLVNVGLKKPISYNEKLGIYNNGEPSRVNDGITFYETWVAFNPAKPSMGETAFIKFDLLKPYDIYQLNIYTRSYGRDDTDNMTIYGSNEDVPTSQMEVICDCKDGFPPRSKSTVEVGGKNYRYIVFEKVANGHFVVSEIEVMAKTDINFKSDWQIEQDDTSFTAVLNGVEYTGAEKDLIALAIGHDTNGHLTCFETEMFTLANGSNTILFEGRKQDGTSDVYVVLLDSSGVIFRPSTANTEAIGTERVSAPLSGEEVAFFIILKSGLTFDTTLTKDEILFADMKMTNKEGQAKFSYDFAENDGVGKFNARLYINHADGSVTSENFIYYHYTQADVDAMVSDLRLHVTNNNEFAERLRYYTVTQPLFKLDTLPELEDEAVLNVMGESFILVRDLYLKENGNRTDDVINACKTAYVWYAACNASDNAVLDKYGDMIESYHHGEHNAEKVLTMMQRLKDTAMDKDSFLTACANACLYSCILETNVEETAEMLKKYASDFGIDLSYGEGKKVTMTEVAKKIDTKHPEVYVGNMAETYKKLVDSIYSDHSKSESSIVNRGNKGQGRGGGTGTVKIKDNTGASASQENQPNQTEPTERPTAGLCDVENIEWARDAIYYLAERNIISGVDGVHFMPEKDITREEMAKMIFLAFTIDVTNGKGISFTDCHKEQWYYPYVEALYAGNIISGISETEFGTGQKVSRQDAVTILSRILAAAKKNISKGDLHYADAAAIAEYAQDAAAKLDKAGLITGFEDGTFRPREAITRAQAAVMIYRIMQYMQA